MTVHYYADTVLALLADASHLPSTQAFGDVPTLGISTVVALSDHKHGMPDGTLGTNPANAFFGNNAGNSQVAGYWNSFFGVDAGVFDTTGLENSFFGAEAGNRNTTGAYNSFFGYAAGYQNTIANNNSFFGKNAGYSNTTGEGNCIFGVDAGYSNTTGNNNSFFGYAAGYTNSGSGNVILGYLAGYYETGSNKLFIDNAPRVNEADARVKALIYGIFDAAVANQSLAFNVGYLGFYGVAPVVRAGAITALSLGSVYATDSSAIQTAVNAIITALKNIGITN